MENILVNSNRSKLLIDDLLTISRLEQEDFQLDLQTVLLDSILEEIFPSLREQAKLAHIQVSIEVEAELEMIADRNKMKTMIVNLLSNASNYPSHPGTVRISLDH